MTHKRKQSAEKRERDRSEIYRVRRENEQWACKEGGGLKRVLE